VLDDEDLRYVYGVGRIAQVGASTHYYLSDGLGSTMALTDEDGDVVNDYDYDVFGALRDSSGSQPNDFTFAGEQVDGSTGLQYLRARYYDPTTGRFVSRDRFAGYPRLPGTQNRYAYGLNNPALYSDPNGDSPLGCLLLVEGGPEAIALCLAIDALITYYVGWCTATDCLDPENFRDAIDTIKALINKIVGGDDEEETPNYEGGFDAPDVNFETGGGKLEANRESVARRGLDPEAVEEAIRRDIWERGAPPANEGYPRGQQPTVNVNGVDIEYRPYTLPNGTVNVGSYTPLN
jgi:RHS repeat-associated protein